MSGEVSFSSNGSSSHIVDRRGFADGKEEFEIVEGNQENPINDAKITQKDLFAVAARIEKAIGEADHESAILDSGELYRQGFAYVRQKSDESHLQITLKSIELLTMQEIQDCFVLKYQLSAISALFAEYLYRSTQGAQNPVYPEVRKELIGNLTNSLSRTPEREVGTFFEIRCCRAAIHEIMPFGERISEAVRENGQEALQGLAAVAGYPPNPGAALAGSIPLMNAFRKEMSKDWYRSIFEMRSAFVSVVTSKDLDSPNIQVQLRKYNTKSKYAICLAQIFSRILLSDPQSEPDLKDRVFREESEEFASLEGLSKVRGSLFKSFWKARYLSVQTLSKLITKNGYRERSISILAERLVKERKNSIQAFIHELYRNAGDDLESWRKVLSSISPEEIQKQDTASRQEIRDAIQKTRNEQEGLEEKKDKLGLHSGMEIGDEDDLEGILDKITQLELKQEHLENEEKDFEVSQKLSLQLISDLASREPESTRRKIVDGQEV